MIDETPASPELRKPISCFVTTTQPVLLPKADQFTSFRSLTEAVAQSCHGAAGLKAFLSADEIQEAEREILRQAQQDSFAEEFNLLSQLVCVQTPVSDDYVCFVLIPFIMVSYAFVLIIVFLF